VGEYGGNICTHVLNETCWTYFKNGGEEIKEDDGGVNSTMIYCKNYYKCQNVPPAQQL
jgi:hypothetical protein